MGNWFVYGQYRRPQTPWSTQTPWGHRLTNNKYSFDFGGHPSCQIGPCAPRTAPLGGPGGPPAAGPEMGIYPGPDLGGGYIPGIYRVYTIPGMYPNHIPASHTTSSAVVNSVGVGGGGANSPISRAVLWRWPSVGRLGCRGAPNPSLVARLHHGGA